MIVDSRGEPFAYIWMRHHHHPGIVVRLNQGPIIRRAVVVQPEHRPIGRRSIRSSSSSRSRKLCSRARSKVKWGLSITLRLLHGIVWLWDWIARKCFQSARRGGFTRAPQRHKIIGFYSCRLDLSAGRPWVSTKMANRFLFASKEKGSWVERYCISQKERSFLIIVTEYDVVGVKSEGTRGLFLYF